MSEAPGLRALVVDDSIVARKVLVMTLREIEIFRRARIDEAGNGAIALTRLSEGRYDLVLSDVRMPFVDGIELVRRVRDELGDARTPIVLISTLGSDADVCLGLDAGATAYILKPLSPPVIRQAIEGFLRDGTIAVPAAEASVEPASPGGDGS